MELTARELAAITGGTRRRRRSRRASRTSFAIDSRALEPGACFVALRRRARRPRLRRRRLRARRDRRARRRAPSRSAAPRVRGRAGRRRARRARAPRRGCARDAARATRTVVGITGSAGKTGTKDLTAAALAPKFARARQPRVASTTRSGVPLTLLGAPLGHRGARARDGRARPRRHRRAVRDRPPDRRRRSPTSASPHAGPLGGPRRRSRG